MPPNLKATQEAARQALALFAVTVDSKTEPVFEAPFTPKQREEITARCYELLLVLAEAKAQLSTLVRKAL